MGAILGRIDLGGQPVAEAVFRRAFDVLRPGRCVRSDVMVSGAAAYGHHDMGLTRAERRPQPCVDGSLVVVADAILDSRAALGRELGVPSAGLSDSGLSDAELILQAYRRWGPDCLSRLNGDFGFAVHDRDRQEVFLARDHIGARPLYWVKRGREVLFGTLLSGLRALDDLDWPLNESRIARYLSSPMENRLETFLDGVAHVGPGQCVRITRDTAEIRHWWNPGALPERRNITAPDAEAEFRSLTIQAVQDRLATDAPVGSHFSGGIDSTLVTKLASARLRQSDRNLTAAYAWCPPVDAAYPDMGPGDERRIISAIAADLGVPVRYGSATGETFDTLVNRPMELEGVADLMDELPVIETARNDGIGIMLSGWGGDEVASSHGAGHLAWLLQRGRLRQVLQTARLHGGGLRRPDRMARFLWRLAIVPGLPDLAFRYFSPFENLYADGAFPSDRMRSLDQSHERPTDFRLVPDADAYMRALLFNGHIGERMATWAAWAAPAGFIYRYPLTDRRLLEFILTLPRELRFGSGLGRHLIRRAFADMLPKGLKKNDLANEKLRADNRDAWWASVAKAMRDGDLATDCPWLEMPHLIDALAKGPRPGDRSAIKIFAQIFVAMRAMKVHERNRSTPVSTVPAGLMRWS